MIKLWHRLMEEAGEPGEQGGGGGEAVVSETTPNESTEAPWWKDQFSESTTADEGIQGLLGKYKSADEFARGAANLAKKIGEKGIVPPGENASDEERAEFFKALGRPEKPDDYSWQPNEGIELDPEVYSEKSQALYEAGLTDSQHKAVMDLYASEVQRINETFQSEQADIARATEASLREEWGKDYDTRVKTAAKIAEKYGVIDSLKESGMINHLGVIKMLDEVARSVREDSIDGSSPQLSREEQISQLKKHPAYNDKSHPEHRQVVEQVIRMRA